MAVRTTSGSVQSILLSDYDGTSSLTTFIQGASFIVDRLVTCAAEDGTTFSSDELELIEAYLAAYRYTLSDRVYTSKSTSKASGSFLHDKEHNPYLKGAMDLDPTGCLRQLLSNKYRAGAEWLGKAPSEQVDYEDRD